MASSTANYGFQKPTVGSDNNLWGGYLNGNWDAIDAALKALQDQVNQQRIPIGGLFMNSTGNDPATELGYGTWEAYAAGRAIVGVGNNGESAWTAGLEQGSETHTLTEAELPTHNHNIDAPSQTFTTGSDGAHTHAAASGSFVTTTFGFSSSGPGGFSYGAAPNTASAGDHTHSVTVDLDPFFSASTGSGTAHNNIQPSIAVHVWRRTA